MAGMSIFSSTSDPIIFANSNILTANPTSSCPYMQLSNTSQLWLGLITEQSCAINLMRQSFVRDCDKSFP